MRLLLFSFLILLSANAAKGQCGGSLWYFDNGVGLDFTTSPPTLVYNSHDFLYSTTHLYDTKGNLIYYTDFLYFYNSENELILRLPQKWGISNGCFVPDIANSSRLYMIYQTGDNYELIHLELGNPDEEKRIVSRTTFAENNHLGGIASYYYPSIQKSLVVLTFADSVAIYLFHANGTYEKLPFAHPKDKDWRDPFFSPSGKFFTLSMSNELGKDRYDTNIYTFDPENLGIQLHDSIKYAYGPVSFSSSERFIYLYNNIGEFLQFDTTTKEITPLHRQRIDDKCMVGQPALGPDGKIYLGQYPNNTAGPIQFAVIQEPDLPGTACRLELGVITFTVGKLDWRFVRPTNFCLSPHISMQIQGKYCTSGSLQFKAIAPQATSYRWDFGDGQYGTKKREEHNYRKAGNYTVRLTTTHADGDVLERSYTIVINDEVPLSNIHFDQ